MSLQAAPSFGEAGGPLLLVGLTEQAAFFEPADGVEGHEAGTEGLLDALAAELAPA